MLTILFAALRRLPLTVYLGIGVLAAFGIMQWKHSREVGRLEKDIAVLTMQRDDQLRQKLEFKAALSDMTANRDKLQSVIEQQNNAIDHLQQVREAEQQAAAAAALRALARGRAEADALRAPTTTVPPGHAAMNSWLGERFGGQQP